MESMDLTSKELSRSAVTETSLSRSEPSTPSSSACGTKDTFNPPKGPLLLEAQNANTTLSPIQEKKPSNLLKHSLSDCARGQPEDGDLVDRSLVHSPIHNWITYPLVYPLLGEDDGDLFISRLIWRERLRYAERYPYWFLHVIDIVHLLDLVQRYLSDVLAQVFTIRIDQK